MRVAAAILALVAGAAPAAAQDASVDPSAIDACLASTPIGARSPDCLGGASDVCQGRPGGGSTIGIVECIGAETAEWDRLLNSEYRATRAALRAADAGGAPSGSRAEALLQAQRAWIAFRDAECTLSYLRWQDGTIRGIAAANCAMVMTAERTVELRDMRAEGQ